MEAYVAAGCVASNAMEAHRAAAQSMASTQAGVYSANLGALRSDRLTCAGCGAPLSFKEGCSYCLRGKQSGPRIGYDFLRNAYDIRSDAGVRSIPAEQIEFTDCYFGNRPPPIIFPPGLAPAAQAIQAAAPGEWVEVPAAYLAPAAPWLFRLSPPVWMTPTQRKVCALAVLALFSLLLVVAEMTNRGM